MSNRYEQSMREQAERIRRELAVQKKPKSEPIERPNKEAQEERFVATDVPSPIYGFQRPRTKAEMESRTADLNRSRSLQAEEVSLATSMGKVEKHETQSDSNEGLGDAIETGDIPVSFAKADLEGESVEETLPPELEKQEDLLEDGLDLLEDVQVPEAFEATEEIEEVSGSETDGSIPEVETSAPVKVTDEIEEGYVPETDLDQLIPDAAEQEQDRLEDEEAPESDLDLPEVEASAPVKVTDEIEEGYVPETDLDQIVPDAAVLGTAEYERPIPQEMEETGEVSTSDEGSSDEGVVERQKALEETVLATAIKKPTGPPVNVIMTTKDLMAMYRTRREQNNLHGKK